jgi:cytochrome o ubiquinol oxidase subunit 1
MPLYALGFMGMTRRLNTTDNPDWTPYLHVAFWGAALIMVGIACQLIQIYVSIRDREQNRDLTGDPWNGHTLEWSTSSPPPFYNFAELPKANEIDAFYAAKRDGEAYSVPAKYSDIHMPNNTATGLVMGALLTVFGFAMIWHIFWLAGVSLVGTIVYFVIHAARDDQGYMVPASEVARIEGEQHKILASVRNAQANTPVNKLEQA